MLGQHWNAGLAVVSEERATKRVIAGKELGQIDTNVKLAVGNGGLLRKAVEDVVQPLLALAGYRNDSESIVATLVLIAVVGNVLFFPGALELKVAIERLGAPVKLEEVRKAAAVRTDQSESVVGINRYFSSRQGESVLWEITVDSDSPSPGRNGEVREELAFDDQVRRRFDQPIEESFRGGSE